MSDPAEHAGAAPGPPRTTAGRGAEATSRAPRQASLRRMREHAVRPKRNLGQNFLVDDNLLPVISDLAALRPEDVVLEVGGGLGVLSEHLAPLVAHLHVVELDEALAPPLRQALAPFGDGATLHVGDAVRMDLAALDPAPTAVVANLPYGVAATVLLETVVTLPGVDRWVGMVQREVGERFAAAPGTPAYGAPSVLAQLSCRVRVLRQVGRRVFSPVPNVDSVLLGMTRARPPAPAAVRDLVHDGFAHRRKALARSASLAPGAPAGRREALRTALEACGHPADLRAERLGPAEATALAAALADVEDRPEEAAAIRAWVAGGEA